MLFGSHRQGLAGENQWRPPEHQRLTLCEESKYGRQNDAARDNSKLHTIELFAKLTNNEWCLLLANT